MGTIDYEVTPAGRFTLAVPLVFAGLLLLGLAVMIALNYNHPLVLAGAVPGFLMLVAVMLLFGWTIRHPRVRLHDGELQVGRFPRLHVRASNLALGAARVVDLGAERDLQPAFRLMGTSLPGLNTGWFWLRDRSRAFLLVTDRKRVLVLPRDAGGPVLLSLRHPEKLLEDLKRSRR
jgi:hypothetical protein